MHPLMTCLWFDDQADEAVDLYCSVFPGSRVLSRIPYPAGAPGPEGSTMVVTFEINGTRLQALNGGPLFQFSEAVSLVVELDTQEEIDRVWDALTADGGSPGPCGWLKDRYGLSWQVVPTGFEEIAADPDRYARAMQALLAMSKPDLAALRAAADGP